MFWKFKGYKHKKLSLAQVYSSSWRMNQLLTVSLQYGIKGVTIYSISLTCNGALIILVLLNFLIVLSFYCYLTAGLKKEIQCLVGEKKNYAYRSPVPT